MAFENEERIELASIQKNNRGDYLKVAKIKNKNTGSESVDIRMFYTDDNDNVLPTKKGVRFNSEMLVEVMEALAGALEENEVMDLADKFSAMTDDEEAEDTEEE